MHKVVAPELKGRILDELDEGDEESPGVWPVDDQPLQQDPAGGSGETRELHSDILTREREVRSGRGRRPTW